MTRGCKATETLPVTPEAITLGPAVVTRTHKQEALQHNISDSSTGPECSLMDSMFITEMNQLNILGKTNVW